MPCLLYHSSPDLNHLEKWVQASTEYRSLWHLLQKRQLGVDWDRFTLVLGSIGTAMLSESKA